MNTYQCHGHRKVVAETIKEAAKIFAERQARRRYGRSAHCRTCTMGAYAQNGKFAEFSAFIGYIADRREPNTTTGTNFNFTVYLIP